MRRGTRGPGGAFQDPSSHRLGGTRWHTKAYLLKDSRASRPRHIHASGSCEASTLGSTPTSPLFLSFSRSASSSPSFSLLLTTPYFSPAPLLHLPRVCSSMGTRVARQNQTDEERLKLVARIGFRTVSNDRREETHSTLFANLGRTNEAKGPVGMRKKISPSDRHLGICSCSQHHSECDFLPHLLRLGTTNNL